MKLIFATFLFSSLAFAGNLSALIGGGGGSSGPTFAGQTTATYDGNLGGLVGANAKCQAEFSGSHFCSATEYVRTGTSTAPTSDSWIMADSTEVFKGVNHTNSSGRYGCSGWLSNTSSFLGGTISSSGGYSIESCNNVRTLLCCK